MSEQIEKDFYSPSEVADMLHVSVDQLRQMRWQGRIQGTSFGNSTVYTKAQIQSADLSPWPRGRKPKRAKKNGADERPAPVFDGKFSKVLLTKSLEQSLVA